MPSSRVLWIIVATVLATAILGLLILNLTAGEQRIDTQVETTFGLDDPQFRREMGVLLGPAILDGNTVTALNNGDEIFPAMLAAIDSAEQTITFETYIYWGGEVGRQFAEALARKARAGVRVHALADWAGALKMDDESVQMMKDAGV